MYGHLINKHNNKWNMDKTDIQYLRELVKDALDTKEWDNIYEVYDYLLEILDEDKNELEE